MLAAVCVLNRVELAGETLRAALEVLACAVPDWLAEAVLVREWADRYGLRTHSWHLPASTPRQGSWWTGYKIHISESCDETDEQDSPTGQATIPGAGEPSPHLITDIATTDATVTDAEMTEPVRGPSHARCP
ncbi:hypothetical protein [Streptomyces sp. NBC_00893]|uniref:hypothetical protein n=1 Tax=Streptomyces sp. NBC_00893 TaxID=2975862 RepID=UPI0022579EEA|nr:hypothetical protein [Streptomyces sp. NBC_00893]MCX4850050.1 hypothetical protein [Streptomyces sp. NBC_00893]